VKRFLGAKRLVATAMIAVVAVALGIGLWPVDANVFGDASYSCGSGFIHSRHDWNVDSVTLDTERIANGTADSLPSGACPDKVESRRDLALLLIAFSLAIGLIAEVMLDRPRQPKFGTTLIGSRRRSGVRPPMPIRRARSEESSLP
jgi:hypothetical protein